MKNITLANVNIFDLIMLLCVAALTDTFSFVIQLAEALYLISSVFCTKSYENIFDLITLLCVAALTDTFSFVIQLLAKALFTDF